MKNLTLLKNQLLKNKQQRGLTLIEVGLAVLISAIIIIGVMYMYQSSSTNASVYQFNNDMTSIRAAANGYYKSSGSTAADLKTLISADYLILGKSKDGTGADPWSGNYALTSAATTGSYTVTASGVPDTVCSRLPAEWQPQAQTGTVTCSGGKFSATFSYQ